MAYNAGLQLTVWSNSQQRWQPLFDLVNEPEPELQLHIQQQLLTNRNPICFELATVLVWGGHSNVGKMQFSGRTLAWHIQDANPSMSNKTHTHTPQNGYPPISLSSGGYVVLF